MNRTMYAALATAIIFLLACVAIRYKDILIPQTLREDSKAQQEEIDKASEAVLAMINQEAEQPKPTKAPPPAKAAIKGPVLALSGINNLAKNPSANSGTEHWTIVGNVAIAPAENKNPAFILQNNGRLKQKIKLINAHMQYIVVGTCGYSSHVNNDKSDPAGLPLVRIYFEDRFGKSHTDDSIEIVMTKIDKSGWGQIGIVQQIPTDTLYLHLELYQAKGNTSLQERTTRFDDICVSIARTKEAGSKILDSYLKQAQAFKR